MDINDLIEKLKDYRDNEGVTEVVFSDEYGNEYRELDFGLSLREKTTLIIW